MPPGTTYSSPSHPNIEYIKGYANDSYDAFIRIRLINYDMTENNNTRENDKSDTTSNYSITTTTKISSPLKRRALQLLTGVDCWTSMESFGVSSKD